MFGAAVKRLVGLAVAVALGVATLTGCAPSQARYTAGSELNIGESALLKNLNSGTIGTIAEQAATEDLRLLTMPAFYSTDAFGAQVANEGFGTVSSDDAKRVTYQIAGKSEWSDGAKVTSTDLLLSWAAATNWGGAGFKSRLAATSLATAKTLPAVVDKSVTISYPRVTPDYRTNLPITVAAHLVGQLAFPSEQLSAPDADTRVAKAILNNDAAALAAIAEAYNNAFASTSVSDGTPLEWTSKLFVTGGAYAVVSATPSKVVLKANPAFQTGKQASVDVLNINFYTDANELAAAAKAGKVDLARPLIGASSSLDSLKSAVSGSDSISVRSGYGGLAQYLVFNRAEGSELAVKPDGSNQALVDAKLQASSIFFPRAGIISALSLLGDVEKRDSFVFGNSAADYSASSSQNGSRKYRFQQAERALQILVKAGFARRIQMRVLFDSNSANGQLEFGLLSRYAKVSGINVVNVSSPTPYETLASGEWEVYLADLPPMSDSSSTLALATGAVTAFSSAKVDALVAKAVTSSEPASSEVWKALDKQLFDDYFGLPVISTPNLLLYSKVLRNFSANLATQQVSWGYWNWDVAAPPK